MTLQSKYCVKLHSFHRSAGVTRQTGGQRMIVSLSSKKRLMPKRQEANGGSLNTTIKKSFVYTQRGDGCSLWYIKIQYVLLRSSFPLKTDCNTALWLVRECWGETKDAEWLVRLWDRKRKKTFASLHWLSMKSGQILNYFSWFTRDSWRLHHIWRGWWQYIIPTDCSSLSWMVTAGTLLSSPLLS